jgi:predicted AAA+ superfamily ATPase
LDLVDKEKIIVEVGFNKETTEQIKNTSKKVKAKYGILIGSKKLELQDDLIVKIPLNYWLLV